MSVVAQYYNNNTVNSFRMTDQGFLLFIFLRRTQRIKYDYRYHCYYFPSPALSNDTVIVILVLIFTVGERKRRSTNELFQKHLQQLGLHKFHYNVSADRVCLQYKVGFINVFLNGQV